MAPSTRDLEGTVGLLALLADPTRLRLLHLCDGEELTVAELTRITELAQSRVSTHLGKLRGAGLVAVRRVGASTLYTVRPDALTADVRGMWQLVRGQTDDRLLQCDCSHCGRSLRLLSHRRLE